MDNKWIWVGIILAILIFISTFMIAFRQSQTRQRKAYSREPESAVNQRTKNMIEKSSKISIYVALAAGIALAIGLLIFLLIDG